MNTIGLGLSLVMAGTGDLNILRLLRGKTDLQDYVVYQLPLSSKRHLFMQLPAKLIGETPMLQGESLLRSPFPSSPYTAGMGRYWVNSFRIAAFPIPPRHFCIPMHHIGQTRFQVIRTQPVPKSEMKAVLQISLQGAAYKELLKSSILQGCGGGCLRVRTIQQEQFSMAIIWPPPWP